VTKLKLGAGLVTTMRMNCMNQGGHNRMIFRFFRRLADAKC